MITGIQLVEYILEKYGPQPQKKLQKLAYLAEIGFIERRSERLSDLSFIKYYYGPFSIDIRNIEDLDENIIIREKPDSLYPSKVSEFIGNRGLNPIDNQELSESIDDVLKPYLSKTGKELEEISDKTGPFLEAEKLNDRIDLDSYAWYYSKVNSDDFWKKVSDRDKENENNGVYGGLII